MKCPIQADSWLSILMLFTLWLIHGCTTSWNLSSAVQCVLVFYTKESDSRCCKSSLNAGCLRASIWRKLENTQQRARRISTKASVWASSASQSNIWKHFLSCNNKNTQHPRFQAQHSCIEPHCPLWSGLRKEAYTEIQLGLNASAQRLPLSDGRYSQILQITHSWH